MPNPVVWLVVDGLGHKLNALIRRSMPPIKGGRETAYFPLEPLYPNCQTPPSLYSIWSGVHATTHGLYGYLTPFASDTNVGASSSSFDNWPKDIPMIWDRYAKAGKTVSLHAVPFVKCGDLAESLRCHTSVFNHALIPASLLQHGSRLAMEGVISSDISVRRDETCFDLISVRDGARLLRINDGGSALLALTNDGRLEGSMIRGMRFRSVLVDGEPHLYCHGFQPVRVTGSLTKLWATDAVGRSYIASNPAKAYQKGRLGRKLCEGGDGSAEYTMLRLLKDVHDDFAFDLRWSLKNGPSDLTVWYYPVIDLVSHQLLKYLHESEPNHQAIAIDIFSKVLAWLDEVLEDACDQTSGFARVIVNSDHGMSPVLLDIFPNPYLVGIGALNLDGQGQPIFDAAAAFYHPAENGNLLVHEERLRSIGLSVSGLIAGLNSELQKQTNAEIGVFRMRELTQRSNHWDYSNFLVAPEGYRLRADVNAPIVGLSEKGGDHTVDNGSEWLKGVFFEMTRIEPHNVSTPTTLVQLTSLLDAELNG